MGSCHWRFEMTSLFSSTYDPIYDFYIPIASYCWDKLGVESLVAVPKRMMDSDRYYLIKRYSNASFAGFQCREDKEATYSQLSRLYLASELREGEIAIISDVDMAFFGAYMIKAPTAGFIDIYGADLVPPNQVPMCYLVGAKRDWENLMQINGRSLQKCLDDALGHEEMQNMRGCLWARDQETAHKHIINCSIQHTRARPGTQFASNRADRDDINWRFYLGLDLVDAHLWRPGYEEANFANIMELLQTQYPEDNFQWLIDYRNEYIKLL